MLVLVFLSWVFFPLHCAGWERKTPPLCSVREHVLNVLPPASGVRAFSEPIPSAFASMQRGYYLLS